MLLKRLSYDDKIWDFEVTNDFNFVVTTLEGYTIEIRNVDADEKIKTYKFHNWSDKIAVSPNGKYIASKTHYINSLILWNAEDYVVSSPERFKSHENIMIYPNPLTNKSKIHYSIDRAQHVSMKIIDLLGRDIRTLFSGWQEQGGHDLIINSESLPSNQYLLIFRTNDRIQTKKITIIN